MSSRIDDIHEPEEGQDDAGSTTAIQLGFSVPMEDSNDDVVVGHRSPRWTEDWDGGQIGGRPSWLQPRDIPKQPLKCLNCDSQLGFLCQLYAPAPDRLSSRAFHRSLYVFGCSSCKTETEGSVRVLRGQLPKQNPFYPSHCNDSDDDIRDWKQHTPEAWKVSLCRVCGQRGKGLCPVQKFSFCGRQHQKEHKQHVFDIDKLSQDKQNQESVFLPSVYAESELVVEEEPPEKHDEEDLYQNKTTMFSNVDETDLDEHLEQEDLNELTGSSANTTKDPVTLDFYSRLKRPNNAQEQVLRYCQWPEESVDGAPLWIRSDFVPERIPSCPHCGEPRRFEFQLMPQMLHYLLEKHRKETPNNSATKISDATKQAVMAASAIVEQNPEAAVPEDFQKTHQNAISAIQNELLDNNKEEMDWGVIAVYTCTASCGGHEDLDDGDELLGAYREEYAWRQPPLH